MKVTQEKLPASQIGLEIEVTPEMSRQAYEKTLQEFTRHANIPGFRKGKVPRQVLIQRFGSNRIKAAVIEDLIQDSLKQAIEQEKIDAIGQFELRSSFDDLIAQYEPGSALTFSAAVDVPPEVELSDYTGIEVKAEEVTYDPERVEKVLADYRQRFSTLVPVEGRPAQMGDVAMVDFSGIIADETGEDGEPQEIPGGSAQDFELELAEGRFIPGFIDGIVGMEPGDTKEVTATFPEEYPQPELAGKPAVFTVTLKELKERELPELDDDFAQEISEFETLTELRESLETRFKEEADQKTKNNKHEAILNELVKHISVELPETLVKREVDYSITQTAMRLGEQGLDIKKAFTSEVISALREQARPEAIDRLKRTLALGEVAKKESLTVEKEAIDERVKEILNDFAEQSQEIDMERLRQVVEEDLLKEKILGWVEEHGSVELVPEGSLTPEPSPEEAEAEFSQEDAEVTLDAAEATIDVEAEVEPETEAEALETTASATETEAEAEEDAAAAKKRKKTKADS
ncbi:MAG: trigger factor [Elainellaceae cyanobacterium]